MSRASRMMVSSWGVMGISQNCARRGPRPLLGRSIRALVERESATAAHAGGRSGGPVSADPVEELLGAPLHVEAGVLLGLVARKPRDALHEIEDAFGRAALFHQHLLDDPARLRLRETALAQEVIPVLVRPRHDLLPRRFDAVHEALRRGIGKPRESGCRLMGKARGSVFRVADLDFLEILDTPEIPILTHGPQVEARHAKGLGPYLGVPAIKAPEIEVGRAVSQLARLDRVAVIDQEQEDVPVRGIERGRVAADFDIGVVDPGRPVEHTRYLPTRVARAIARDALHRLDQLAVMDAGIVGAGPRAKFGTAVFRLEGLNLLGAVFGQAVL